MRPTRRIPDQVEPGEQPSEQPGEQPAEEPAGEQSGDRAGDNDETVSASGPRANNRDNGGNGERSARKKNNDDG
jgi:hypothetical protein